MAHELIESIRARCQAGKVCPSRTAAEFAALMRAARAVLVDVHEERMDFIEASASALEREDKDVLGALRQREGVLGAVEREAQRFLDQGQKLQEVLREARELGDRIDDHIDRALSDVRRMREREGL